MGTEARAYIAGLFLAVAVLAVGAPRAAVAANNSVRTISIYNIHTKETLTVAYKKYGKYVPEAMKQINFIMRDWRKNKVITIDPELVDLMWEIHHELGSKEPIHLICGHRSQATNEMLRKTRGGQASKSQHITGHAADMTFPDVPLRQLRYSALIRERGGVGYYPTSGIPFVHVDTARVRAWPRLPRYELASLFPSGHTQHRPKSGGPITMQDVRDARTKHKDVYKQVAEYFATRGKPRKATTLVASADTGKATPASWPKPAIVPASGQKVAALAPAPKLVSPPKIVERPARLVKSGPDDSDRAKLAQLATLASYEPEPPRLTAAPQPAHRPDERPQRQFAMASLGGPTPPPAPAATSKPVPPLPAKAEAPRKRENPRLAALDPAATAPGPSNTLTDAARFGWGDGWVQAPEFDEEHPEELSYRPFPIGPLLTAADGSSDALLADLVHPDVQKTLELMDDEGIVLPMRMRPGAQIAELMWARQFTGQAVDLTLLTRSLEAESPRSGIADRSVDTETTR